MENGEATFYGMSSVNEYWNRASETDRSEIKTSSSDDSADESSSCKEYRDASCYVDSDEFNDIVDDDTWNIVEDSRKIIKLSESKIEGDVKHISSRYIRWNVLISLGLGLWAILCIVDVLHSDNTGIRGWFVEFMREKKNISKIVLVERTETHVSWLFHLWPYFCKIIWIFSSGGAYILLILLLIVFCTDPRLRKTVGQTIINNNLNKNISTTKEVKNSIVENKTLSIQKKIQNPLVVRPIPSKLVLNPAIYLDAKILSSVVQQLYDLKTIQTRKSALERRIINYSNILQPCDRRLSECRTSLTINQSILGQLHITNCRTLKLSNVNRTDEHSIAKASASVYLMDSSTSTCSLRKVHFEVEEYLKKTKKYSNTFNSFKTRSIESKRNSSELSSNGETKTRIITSSPAFKNFLLRLKDNSCVS